MKMGRHAAALSTLVLTMCAGLFVAEADAQSVKVPAVCDVYQRNFTSDAVFQAGLAEAERRRWQAAEACFLKAARDGDRDFSVMQPWLQSTKPEVWFNLGLARSNIRGAELGAMAAFQAYLELAPNSANAAAVKQQITQLHTTLKQDIRYAIAKSASTMPKHPWSDPRYAERDERYAHERFNSADSGIGLAEAHLYAGDPAGAEKMMQTFVAPDWRDEERAHRSSFPDSWRTNWPKDPDETYWTYPMSRGDIASARQTLEKKRISYTMLNEELAFACSVRDVNAEDDLKWIADRFRQRDYQREYSSGASFYLGRAALLLLQLGDRAFAENAAAKVTGNELKELQSALRGETPVHVCESGSFIQDGYGYGRWWGTGRLWYARKLAIDAPTLLQLFDNYKGRLESTVSSVNAAAGAHARDFRNFAQRAHRLRAE
ncbi:MAG: hypothetical protein ABL956_13810 [Hyphomonadaceae bacterium]